MEIKSYKNYKDYSAGINSYKYNTECAGVKRATVNNSAKNVDTVQISSANAKASKSSFTALDVRKSEISGNIKKATSEERIASLRKMISEGTYCVTAEDVACAILD